VNWLGRRAKTVTRDTSTLRWRDHGQIDWLITSERIVGRLPASREMISVWWSGLAGIDIDLKRDCIVLNGMNGWTGMLTGPAVAQIAVAAIAMCYGLEALLVHPAVEFIRRSGRSLPPGFRDQNAVGTGGLIVRFPTRMSSP
jgi:hypothetical protein